MEWIDIVRKSLYSDLKLSAKNEYVKTLEHDLITSYDARGVLNSINRFLYNLEHPLGAELSDLAKAIAEGHGSSYEGYKCQNCIETAKEVFKRYAGDVFGINENISKERTLELVLPKLKKYLEVRYE